MDAARRGAIALQDSKYEEAVKQYTAALKQSPESPHYFIERSKANHRHGDHQQSLLDAENGVVYGDKRGKRELIVEAQKRRYIALFYLERYGDAQYIFGVAKEMDPKDKITAIWEQKISKKLNGLPEDDIRRAVTIQKRIPDAPHSATPSTVASTEDGLSGGTSSKTTSSEAVSSDKSSAPATAHPAAGTAIPASVTQTPADKIKYDWYQNESAVIVTILAKGAPKDQVQVEFGKRSVTVSFPLLSGSTYDLSLDPLYSAIVPNESIKRVTPNKIEITLKKETSNKWKTLESDDLEALNADKPAPSTAPAYPTSSKNGPKNWDKVVKESTRKEKTDDAGKSKVEYDDLDQEDGGDDVNYFFKKLYAGADDDTKRAMMKSYQESNGTALSTNWADVKKGPVETSPPDGMEAKKWDG